MLTSDGRTDIRTHRFRQSINNRLELQVLRMIHS